jgi:hypothetical protein
MGGLRLFSHVSSIARQLNISLSGNRINAGVLTPLVVYFDLPGVFSIHVDLNNGKIFKLVAAAGYRGFFSETIGIGSTIQDILEKGYNVLFDDFDGTIFIKGFGGICFELEDPNYSIKTLPSQAISSIIVYDPKLDELGEQPEELFF